MSDLYRLALALRESKVEPIARLVHQRSISLNEFQDFFDLAQALLTPKSQAVFISAMSLSQASSVIALAKAEKISKEDQKLLTQDFLAYLDEKNQPHLFTWLAERVSELSKPQLVFEEINLNQDEIDRDCGIAAFEAMQAVTELLFDFDQHLIRPVGKSGIGLQDTKRLADHLGKSKEYVKSIFELARVSSLISIMPDRIRNSEAGWLSMDAISRYQALASGWLRLIGSSGIAQLQKFHIQRFGLSELLEASFPFGSVGSPRNQQITELGYVLGLANPSGPASWLAPLIAGVEISPSLGSHLPKEQNRIILQGDLSIIAPGPLPAKVQIELRKFAITENIGLASGYRLTPLSLSSGMEEGLGAAEIRAFLEELCGANLPQPVDYLIREASERFGRIKIRSLADSSEILITDPALAKQLEIDSKLKSLFFEPTASGLHSSVDGESVYHSLRESGYVAVRIGESGKVIAPSALHQSGDPQEDFSRQLERLRKQDLEMEQEAPLSDLERKIQLALRSKSSLNVEVNSSGKLLNFVLEPIGIANGRLRARDRKADIERTFPVSAITAITIG
ncbi:MAG: helicase-associated domain-containing protein [Actinomycetota bacterium]